MAAIVLFCLALLVCIVLGANILYALLTGLVIFTLYGKKQGFTWKELGKMICSGVKTSASSTLADVFTPEQIIFPSSFHEKPCFLPYSVKITSPAKSA